MKDDKVLIAKIKELKKIQPDKQWVVFCREQVKNEARAQEASFISIFQHIFAKPALVGLMTFVIATTSGLAVVNAAKDSLPGDTFYPVKLALEKIELKLATNETEKTRMEAEITGKRAQELTDIANLPLLSFSKEAREQKVEQAVKQIEQQLSATKENVPALKEKIKSGQDGASSQVAEAAKTVKENTAKLQDAITQIQANLSEISENKALSAKISDISDKLDKTHIEISEIIDSIDQISGDVQKKDDNDSVLNSSNNDGAKETQTTTPETLPF